MSRRSALRLVWRQEGLSYSEILVSIAFIAVAVLGFSLNTIGVVQGNRRSAEYTAATNLAQDKMEQLKAQPSLSNVDLCPDSGEQRISVGGASGGIYNRCWTIKDSPLGSGIKEVSVSVHWRDSELRTVTLSTLVLSE